MKRCELINQFFFSCNVVLMHGLPDCAQVAQDGCNIFHLQTVMGPCSKYAVIRWYYNVDVRDCEQFIYRGCEGNQNCFMTYKDCMKKYEGQ